MQKVALGWDYGTVSCN